MVAPWCWLARKENQGVAGRRRCPHPRWRAAKGDHGPLLRWGGWFLSGVVQRRRYLGFETRARQLSASEHGLASAESAGFSPDGRELMLMSGDQIRLVDAAFGETLLTWRHGPLGAYRGWSTADFSPDGRTIATLGPDARIRLWDVGPGARKYLTSSELPAVLPASYCATPDHADPMPDYRCQAWNRVLNPVGSLFGTRGPARRCCKNRSPSARALAISPDGLYVVAQAEDKRLCAWETSTAQKTACLPQDLIERMGQVWSSSIGGAQPILAAAMDGDAVGLWRLPTFEFMARIPVSDGLTRLAFRPTTSVLAIEEDSKNITLWDVGSSKPREIYRLWSPEGRISTMAFSPDGDTFWVASGSRISTFISRWGTATWKELADKRLRLDTPITALAASPPGRPAGSRQRRRHALPVGHGDWEAGDTPGSLHGTGAVVGVQPRWPDPLQFGSGLCHPHLACGPAGSVG